MAGLVGKGQAIWCQIRPCQVAEPEPDDMLEHAVRFAGRKDCQAVKTIMMITGYGSGPGRCSVRCTSAPPFSSCPFLLLSFPSLSSPFMGTDKGAIPEKSWTSARRRRKTAEAQLRFLCGTRTCREERPSV